MTTRGAIIINTLPGTNAPPAILGGYLMAGFPAETRLEFDLVANVTAPLGGTLSFTTPMELNDVGSGWPSWSHGYSGSAYAHFGEAVGLLFPANIQAFYLYIQPNLFGVFEFEVESHGVSKHINIDGNGGASFVGIYSDDPSFDLLGMTITQTGGQADGFAIGEFASNVIPEPGSMLGLGCVLASGLAFRNRRHPGKQ